LQTEILRELKLDKAASALRPVRWLLWLQLAAGVASAVLLGGFLGVHWRDPRFVIPALALDGAAVLMIAGAAGQLRRLESIDLTGPVVAMQGGLAAFAVARARHVRWYLLLVPALWTPFAIVALQGLFGFDVYRWFGARWIAANVAFSIALTPFLVWAARRHEARIRREGLVKSLADDITGRRLSLATRLFDEVIAFEKGPS
jgi:hypothetical protein